MLLSENSQTIALANELTQKGVFDFTVNEWYLFLYSLSQRHHSTTVDIDVAKFKKLFELSSYDAIRESAESLSNKVIMHKEKEIKIFKRCTVSKKHISVEFAEDLLPYLSFGNGNMTIIYVGYLKVLRSKHLIRMYLFASSFRNNHLYMANMEKFKKLISDKNLYDSEFTRNILIPAKNSLKEKTDLIFNYKDEKGFYIFYCRVKHTEELVGKIPDWKRIKYKDEIQAMLAEAEYEFSD